MELAEQAARIRRDLIAKSRKALAEGFDPLSPKWCEADRLYHEARIADLESEAKPDPHYCVEYADHHLCNAA